MTYAEIIEKAMKEKHINKSTLAEMCNINASYITKILRHSQKPTDEITERIANILELDIEELKLQAYLENAPTQITEFFSIFTGLLDFIMNTLFTHSPETLANANIKINVEQYKNFLSEINSFPLAKFIIKMLDTKNNIIENTKKICTSLKMTEINPKTGKIKTEMLLNTQERF